jgi:hypothetical protein
MKLPWLVNVSTLFPRRKYCLQHTFHPSEVIIRPYVPPGYQVLNSGVRFNPTQLGANALSYIIEGYNKFCLPHVLPCGISLRH